MVTVLAADAAGYSRAMSLDEARALAALAASRRIIDGLVNTSGGRIFSTGGDSVLAEFAASDLRAHFDGSHGISIRCDLTTVVYAHSIADASAGYPHRLPLG